MSPIANRRELEIQLININQLFLDDQNPRLSVLSAGSRSQEELVRVLWDEMAVSEVALSIAANGYFEEEPLFVIPRNAKKQEYIVVEGNRRLAAVKLLCDATLRKAVRATDLPSISATRCNELQQLPVSIYPDKKSLWEYFGFRHVNGPKEWDSFSKASYIVDVRRKYNIPLSEIAKKIGDQHSTVARIYRGYVLLEQAEARTDFDRADRIANRFSFSHLYTAADQKEFQEFLGIDPQKSLKDDPVSRTKLSQLYELMVWLYGSKSDNKPPVVKTQNPDLNRLRSILKNKQALHGLRSGMSLEKAYGISLGDDLRFQEALVKAKDALQEAKGTLITGYKGERDMLETMRDIVNLAQSISEEMQKKVRR